MKEDHEAMRAELIRRYGEPGPVAAQAALAAAREALVPVEPGVTADQVYASVYRDQLACNGWMTATRLHQGHPALATVPLPDGRVIGILDLRPALARTARQRRPDIEIPGWEGSIGPGPGQYGRPHVYARDVGSGAGNCICGRGLGDDLHVQAAPGVPVPGHLRRPGSWHAPGRDPAGAPPLQRQRAADSGG